MSKSPSLRRIQADIRELALDPSDRYHAAPLETDMFEWHFTIRGADDTDFAGGVYHGRIMLPAEYPFKPPHIIFLTPSGRFETNTKVCLSFSAYHPELWQPAWGIRLILEALISFLPTPADGAIGALDWTSAERKRLAKKSLDYHCPTCGCKTVELLPKLKPKADNDAANNKPKSKFQKEIEKLQQLQHAQHGEANEENKEGEKKENDKDEKEKEPTKDKEPLLKEEGKEISSEHPKSEEPAKTEMAKPTVVPTSTQATAAETINRTPAPPVQPAQPAVVEPQVTQQQDFVVENNVPAETTFDPPPQEEVQPQHVAVHDHWLADPVLQGIIVVLAVLCFLLLRKLQAMMEELEALTDVLEG